MSGARGESPLQSLPSRSDRYRDDGVWAQGSAMEAPCMVRKSALEGVWLKASAAIA